MPTPSPRDSRTAAAILAACALLGFLALLHHPTHYSPPGAGGAMPTLNALVHGFMLVVMALLVCALAQYTNDRGWARLLPRSGFVLFAIGCAGGAGAALINGFIAMDAISAGADAAVRATLWAANQRLMMVAGFALAAAVACWSLDLWRDRGRRGLAASGLALAVVEIGWQVATDSRYDVAAMQMFWVWLCVACGIYGWVMWRDADGAMPAASNSASGT